MPLNKPVEDAKALTQGATAEVGLFVVWARARHLQDRILADLERRFRICAVHEIHWTPKLVTANFQRFYSDLDLRGVYHRLNKGDGAFLAITVVDPNPVRDVRETGRGRRRVLANFMDAKSLYREWSGGIGIHCGETAWETERDLCMLLGLERSPFVSGSEIPWDRAIQQTHRDLTGATTWQSVDELFGVLNKATNYVAINYDDGDLNIAAGGNVDLDFLTDDYYALHTILSSGRYMRMKPRNGGRMRVRIGDHLVSVGLRFPGDKYFDEAWARTILASRALDVSGYYRPADEERFWLLTYHALVHKQALGANLRNRLLLMANDRGLSEWQSCLAENSAAAQEKMLSLLQKKGITCPQPLDPAIFVRLDDSGKWPFVVHTVARLGNGLRRGRQNLGKLAQYVYWPVRDGLLVRAPWLNKVKHWRRLLT